METAPSLPLHRDCLLDAPLSYRMKPPVSRATRCPAEGYMGNACSETGRMRLGTCSPADHRRAIASQAPKAAIIASATTGHASRRCVPGCKPYVSLRGEVPNL